MHIKIPILLSSFELHTLLWRVLDHFFYSYWIRIQDVNEAEANFKVARSHCQNFAFVHIAHAQFEHSQGKDKLFKTFLMQK